MAAYEKEMSMSPVLARIGVGCAVLACCLAATAQSMEQVTLLPTSETLEQGSPRVMDVLRGQQAMGAGLPVTPRAILSPTLYDSVAWDRAGGVITPYMMGSVTVTGSLTFEDHDANGVVKLRPIRFVDVQVCAVDPGDWPLLGNRWRALDMMVDIPRWLVGPMWRAGFYFQLGVEMTDEAGAFRVNIPALPKEGTKLYLRFLAANFGADVYLDWDEGPARRIVWKHEFVAPKDPPGGIIALPPIKIEDDLLDQKCSQHFNILHTLSTAWLYGASRRSDVDDLPVVFAQYPDTGDVDGNPCYNKKPNDQGISIPGPAAFGLAGFVGRRSGRDSAFNDRELCHEFGHHLVRTIGKTASPGGVYDWLKTADPRQGWEEGFVEYYSYAVGAVEPTQVDVVSQPSFVLPQCQTDSPMGVHSFLRFIHDSNLSDMDRIKGDALVRSKGFDGVLNDYPIRDVILHLLDADMDDGGFPPTVYGFHDAWVARKFNSTSHANLDRLLMGTVGKPKHKLPDYGDIRRAVGPSSLIVAPGDQMPPYEITVGWNRENPYPELAKPRVRAYLTRLLDNTLREVANVELVGRDVVDATGPGIQLKVPFQVPMDVNPGEDYRLDFSVDVDAKRESPARGGEIPEEDETNNLSKAPGQIKLHITR